MNVVVEVNLLGAMLADADHERRMDRAMALRDRLVEATGTDAEDWLSRYRVWLDRQGIHAETNGWPSEESYDDTNVAAFLRDWLGED